MTSSTGFRFLPIALLIGAMFLGGRARGAEADGPGAEAIGVLDPVIVTARLRPESEATVPVSLSVVDGSIIDKTASNNLQQVAQLVPSVNYSSPNPRNTALTIRGLGSSVVAIAQANDGLDPGVGIYVDGVYHGRPATAAFDFVDLDRVEVLRGPQGTLFGKNTTAGAINITTRAPSFDGDALAELSGGNLGYYQARAYVNGPVLGETVAGRLSAVVTGRDGVIRNVTTGADNNDLHNAAARGQLLVVSGGSFRLRLSGDYSAVDANCCTQVYYTVGETQKTLPKQFPALATGIGYVLPSTNPYDRITDIDAPIGVRTSEGGLGAVAEWDWHGAAVTSVSAWRFWNWDAANDRDYTSLSIQTQQHVPSRQDQYSEELRIASKGTNTLDYTAGLYWFDQTLAGAPVTVYGPVATYWLLGPSKTLPGNLLDGYGSYANTRYHADSYALFGELDWHLTERLKLSTGLRYTQEEKQGRYDSVVSGGLQTTDPTFLKAQLSILNPQSYAARVSDGSPSGRMSLSYAASDTVMVYLTAARAEKSGGINMSGLPLNATNQPALNTEVVRPEHDDTVELGLKSLFFGRRLAVDVDVYDTRVRDYQANIVDNAPGALRGYLANVGVVSVRGAEIDSSFRLGPHVTGYLTGAWTEGKYASYTNGPCPLEAIHNSTTICDLSGRPLPGLPRTAASIGAEVTLPERIARQHREWFVRADLSSRSAMYGDASDSKYTLLDGYTVLNASLGLRVLNHWDLVLWARNLCARNYMQNVTVQAGNSGLVVGTPSDPRTYGLTWRMHW